MSLSDLDCRLAKPKEKSFRLYDSGGLYLDIKVTGKKIWRLKYKFFDKEKLLTIGQYPQITLAVARERRDQAKEKLILGIDPSQEKQDQKVQARYKQTQTFELVATEWHKLNYKTWSSNYANDILRRLTRNVFTEIGNLPISKITIQDLLACLRKVEEREAHDMARRVLQMMGQVMRYAVITGRAERDITVDLKGALVKYKKGHYAAIESDELPNLLKTINKNDARLFKQTILAIKLILLTFVRTSELINATWSEFDLEKAEWHIPAERMKMRTPHFVPLSRQVVKILLELKQAFGKSNYILPSVIRNDKPISNGTILVGLKRLGYHKVMTGHGFRALAMSTIKEKLNYRHEIVDRQLAHLPRNKIDQAYDRAKFIPDRIKMMQDWADYIDLLANVTS
ncbi:MAG: integrase arm-type DNA-binding domain-containing protein [Leadbetterella sp.]|nr:integrase arm-type DNA-binding domain-containing protein [Leadbetterella sp.]